MYSGWRTGQGRRDSQEVITSHLPPLLSVQSEQHVSTSQQSYRKQMRTAIYGGLSKYPVHLSLYLYINLHKISDSKSQARFKFIDSIKNNYNTPIRLK